MNDDSLQKIPRQQELSGDKPPRHKVEGKALRVNENSIEDPDPSSLPTPPEKGSGDRLMPHKVEGQALRVNENSIEDQQPERLPAAPGNE